MRLASRGPADTMQLGRRLGRRLKAGDVVCLYGELGSGKTVFVKGIASALGINAREISSASFTIISEHEARIPLYHIDLYRIGSEKELETVGIYDYIGGNGIAVIEWAEKLPEIEGDIKVRIDILSGNKRKIVIEGADPDNSGPAPQV